MQFKDAKVENEYNTKIPTMLQVMCDWLCQLSQAHFQIDAVVTRVLEQVCGDSGVHEAGRAVDLRDEHPPGTFLYSPEQARFLVSEMNRRFPRRDKKLTCIHHSFSGGPFHFHVQSNPVTSEDIGPDKPQPPEAA